MSLIIKNGNIVTETEIICGDIKCKNGIITAIGNDLSNADDEIINAEGKYIFPGGIDGHTHFEMPTVIGSTSDTFYNGTQAAIYGGTTTIIDYANQEKSQSLEKTIKIWDKKSKGNSFCDYSYHFTVSDLSNNLLDELDNIVEQYGINSLKIFFAYKNSLMLNDAEIYKVCSKAAEKGLLIGAHCENGEIISLLQQEALDKGNINPLYHAKTRPSWLEAESVARAIKIAQYIGTKLMVVHTSTSLVTKAVRQAREQNSHIFVETCPHYLLLNEKVYNTTDFESAKYIMSPPLREKRENDLLWEDIKKGVINTIATDHCAYNYKGQKNLGKNNFTKIPAGIAGVETRIPLIYTYGVVPGKITLNRFTQLISTNAARIYGLSNKGSITIGKDADLIIYNPNGERKISINNLHEKVDYTPFEGFNQIGNVEHVFLRGLHIIKNGKMIIEKPSGQYIRRNKI